MRASPAFQISLHRFGVWRSAVLVLAAIGMSAIAAWLISREPPIDIAVLGLAVSSLVLVWLAASLASVPAVSLRWDGQLWHLGAPGALPDAAVSGDLHVAIDLGPWMLLRFRPTSALERRARPTWLPVQRRGIEPQWHALRCSVYSPRPAPGADAATGG